MADGAGNLRNTGIVLVVVRRVVIEVRWRIGDSCSSRVTRYSKLLVHLGLFQPLVFRPSILEPYFDLGFCQVEAGGEFKAPRARDVLVLVEFQLEF